MRFPVLKFDPILLPKPWGGDGLWRALGKGRAEDRDMGESWELSDRPEAETRVSGGPFAGRTLRSLMAEDAAGLLGDLPGDGGFPLLYKFISAREKLSVQVHPGAGSPLGEAKTECWYVVEAVPGAEIIVGVREGLGREEALRLLRSPRCEEALRRLPARAGDMFYLPAGTVHAITEGLLLYELQQNSDTTFRLYDWGRTDAAGAPRALHLAEAGAVADLQAREGYKVPSLAVERGTHRETFLVACPYFALQKWEAFSAAAGPARLETRGRFRVLSAVAGAVEVRFDGPVKGSARLERGDTALVPADLGAVTLEAVPGRGAAEVLVSFVPDLERDVRAPLRAAGHAPAAIEALFGPAGVHV
jgi:mannose-6-phosphate isomerase